MVSVLVVEEVDGLDVGLGCEAMNDDSVLGGKMMFGTRF